MRLALLIGLLVVPIGFVMRRALPETLLDATVARTTTRAVEQVAVTSIGGLVATLLLPDRQPVPLGRSPFPTRRTLNLECMRSMMRRVWLRLMLPDNLH